MFTFKTFMITVKMLSAELAYQLQLEDRKTSNSVI